MLLRVGSTCYYCTYLLETLYVMLEIFNCSLRLFFPPTIYMNGPLIITRFIFLRQKDSLYFVLTAPFPIYSMSMYTINWILFIIISYTWWSEVVVFYTESWVSPWVLIPGRVSCAGPSRTGERIVRPHRPFWWRNPPDRFVFACKKNIAYIDCYHINYHQIVEFIIFKITFSRYIDTIKRGAAH